MKRSAILSCDGLYRYLLRREWDASRPPLGFVMLNPSTADAATDDPTIRRCIGFAQREHCGGLVVANLFAYRATKPGELYAQPAERRIGPDLFDYLREGMLEVSAVVCAWGAGAGRDRVSRLHLERVRNVLHGACGSRVYSLGLTAMGFPRHPLYTSASAPLVPFLRWRGLGDPARQAQVPRVGGVTQ